jgi:hypothetical protein
VDWPQKISIFCPKYQEILDEIFLNAFKGKKIKEGHFRSEKS